MHYFVVWHVKIFNAVKFWLSLVQSLHTLNLKRKFTFFLKKKVDVILHSSQTTAHNSTSVQLT